MPDTTATIAAKGCNSTGITEELAVSLHANLGKKVLAIVELVSEERGEKRNGKEKVILSILDIEPAMTKDAEDHLREVRRALFTNRKLTSPDGQLQIDTRDDLEPTVEGVIAAGKKFEPHEFTEAPEDETICDICGAAKDAPIHDVLDDDVLPEPGDDADGGSDEEPA